MFLLAALVAGTAAGWHVFRALHGGLVGVMAAAAVAIFVQADDELASVAGFREAEAPPSEPNVHWDRKLSSFDEVPENLPPKVRDAIYRWMRERFQ